ncbi:MAG TPA: heme-binding protein, partial [Candidatus Binatia bacterium]|nr:heme-binding protein [Candidatus Binatia bacterium]
MKFEVRFYLRLNFLEGSVMLKNRLAVVIAATVFLVAGSLTALAQGLVTQKLISADQAHTIARGAVDKCRADGYHVTVTVIDEDGLLKAFLRDDGSAPHTIDFSRKKAYSALT